MKGLITIKECDQSLAIEDTRSKYLASVDLETDMMPGPTSNNKDQWRIQPENGPKTRIPSRRRLRQGRQAKQGTPSLGPAIETQWNLLQTLSIPEDGKACPCESHPTQISQEMKSRWGTGWWKLRLCGSAPVPSRKYRTEGLAVEHRKDM